MAVSYKTKHVLFIWPSICTHGIYPSEVKTYIHIKTVCGIFVCNSWLVYMFILDSSKGNFCEHLMVLGFLFVENKSKL